MPENQIAHTLPASIMLDQELMEVVQSCNPEQANAMARALKAAYDAGAQDAEQRTGRFVASVLNPMLGIVETEDVDTGRRNENPRRVLRGALHLLSGLAKR